MSEAVKAAPAQVSDAEWAAWKSFMLMHRALDRRLGDRLQHNSGLSIPDYAVLLPLWEHPDHRIRAGELARAMGWEKSRLSHQLGRLEDRGLVTKEECGDDLRGKWIVITAAGRRAVLGAMRDHNHAIREYFFDLLDAGELATLKSFSDRVLAATCDEEPA